MTNENQGKNSLTQDDGSEGSRIDRRDFLAVGSIAAVSVTGYFAGTADAAALSESTFGYGTESFGAYSYGGVDTTS